MPLDFRLPVMACLRKSWESDGKREDTPSKKNELWEASAWVLRIDLKITLGGMLCRCG